MNAPNTPRGEITREGPYHNVQGGTGLAATVSDDKWGHAKCRKCKEVAAPAHVTNLKASLAVWCEAHCPACIAFRKASAA